MQARENPAKCPPGTKGAELVQAKSARQLDLARGLFREYQAYLNVDLCFQSFEQELAGLPGKYAPPRGALLLAMTGGEAAGCVALRPWHGTVCEMKRLYVRPEYRGARLGRVLSEEIIQRAAALGYTAMRLDTFRRLAEAVRLYESLGFREIPAYCENPHQGVVYLELDLETPAGPLA